jgi:hypothetical protein
MNVIIMLVIGIDNVCWQLCEIVFGGNVCWIAKSLSSDCVVAIVLNRSSKVLLPCIYWCYRLPLENCWYGFCHSLYKESKFYFATTLDSCSHLDMAQFLSCNAKSPLTLTLFIDLTSTSWCSISHCV